MRAFAVRAAAALARCLAQTVVSLGQEILVAPDHDQGVYSPGEPIHWNLQVKGADVSEAAYIVKQGGLTETAKGTVSLAEGKGQIEAKLGEPGWPEVRAQLEPTEHGRHFLGAWSGFMTEHGHHCRGELELFNPRWSDRPDNILG